ncbi:hypothetical protein BGX24_000298 [Mortierella sp. AD032]|nr:hypothetical protein BGX24_000298 [Mortierella sp. AD032]
MDNDNNDDLNNAYMNMLNRNIPGVGNNPLVPSTTTNTTTGATTTISTTHLTNKNTTPTSATTAMSTTGLTQKQRHAIDTLQASLKDALFISEGEEPFQTVHISTATGTKGATTALTTTTTSSFPTEQEFRTLLHTTHLLPSFQSLQEAQDEDEDANNTCERSSDLHSVLSKSNPGSDKIAQALHTIFGNSSLSSSPATATSASDNTNKRTTNDKVMLYRIADPSSFTRVHIWILGWIDGDLIGLHTVSIES